MAGSVLYRLLNSSPPVADHGDGCYLIDSEGRRYLDACAGAGVSCLGHSEERIKSAVKAQIDRLAYAHTSFFSSRAAEEVSSYLLHRAPRGLAKAYFVSGGSEALESAIKIARQYWLERGEPQRVNFISRKQSYHGTTIGALSVGGHQYRRGPYEPLLFPTKTVSPCYPYRNRRIGESDSEYGDRLAAELEAAILELGPQSVIGFVAETVSGAVLGAVPPVSGYFSKVRALCDKYGILLILDEVMCGIGRTGTLFACEQEGISPDMMLLAKGLTAGYQPLGAVLVNREISSALAENSGVLRHGFTFSGHATACSAALATLRIICESNMLDGVKRSGQVLQDALHRRFDDHPFVGEIRGRGLFVAVEFVTDRASKEPWPKSAQLNSRIRNEAFARGLLVYAMGGVADGDRGDHVLIAPPFTISGEQIQSVVEILEQAMEGGFRSVNWASARECDSNSAGD